MDDAFDALAVELAGWACGWLAAGAWLLLRRLRGPPARRRRWEIWEESMSEQYAVYDDDGEA